MRKALLTALVLSSFATGLLAQIVQEPGSKSRVIVSPARGVAVHRSLGAAGAAPTNHGGPVITAAHVVYIFWGPSFANVASPDHTYATTLQSYRSQFGTTPEYNTITQYSGSNGTIALSNLAGGTADWFDTSTPPANVTDAIAQGEVNTYLVSHAFDANAIYEVVLPTSSYSSMGGGTSCGGPSLSYCAYHGSIGSGTSATKYSVQPYPSCVNCQVSGWSAAQNQEHFVCHETREAVTDPVVGTGWTDGFNELDDLCAWSPTPFFGTGGYGYQYEWSNANGGCVQSRPISNSVGSALNSASYVATVSPDGAATLFGSGLGSTTASGSGNPLPTSLAGVSVTFNGASAGLSYVSPTQINLALPAGVATGTASVSVFNGGSLVATGTATVQPVAPGIYSASGTGSGVAAANWQRYNSSGTLVASGNTNTSSIDFGAPTDQVYLILYGTGIRHFSSSVSVTVGGTAGTVTYAGPQGGTQGLDQVNALLSRSLAGRGSGVPVIVTADGNTANTVTVNIL
jgi:uncharacterized protein (TIGR03437 family)